MFDRPFKLVYAALIALRLALALQSTGYIHPDEYFQSAEPALSGLFGSSELVQTWEFDPENPCRSMASIRLFNAPLLLFIKLFRTYYGSREAIPSASALLACQRLTCFAVSLAVDGAMYRLSPRDVAKRSTLLWASSGACLVFATRPFSNSNETALLAISLLCLSSLWDLAQRWRNIHSEVGKTEVLQAWSPLSAMLGCVFGLGIFCRFTFGIFAAPVGFSYLALAWRMAGTRAERPNAAGVAKLAVKSRIGRALLLSSDLLNGLLLCSLGHVLYDTFYYRSLSAAEPPLATRQSWQHLVASIAHRCRFPPVIAPLNNLLYNLDADNLASHGVHPRWLHAVVNMPLLFGPMLYAGWILRASVHSSSATAKTNSKAKPANPQSSRDPLHGLGHWLVLIPLGVLSSQPHQEPRFLLPLAVPLILTVATRFSRIPRIGFAVHAIHSVVIVLFFGYAHQAGLVPALVDINQQVGANILTEAHGASAQLAPILDATAAMEPPPDQSTASWQASATKPYTVDLHVWRAFMPPRHLFVIPSGTDGTVPSMRITDHGSTPGEDLLAHSLPHNASSELKSDAVLSLLLAPAWAMDTVFDCSEWPLEAAPRGIFPHDFLRSASLHRQVPRASHKSGLDYDHGDAATRKASVEPSDCLADHPTLTYISTYAPHLDTDHLGESVSLFRKLLARRRRRHVGRDSLLQWLRDYAQSLRDAFGLVLVRVDPPCAPVAGQHAIPGT
ncbi:unnamed protein product [Parajaminaea phylloscopi]